MSDASTPAPVTPDPTVGEQIDTAVQNLRTELNARVDELSAKVDEVQAKVDAFQER